MIIPGEQKVALQSDVLANFNNQLSKDKLPDL